jgi:hypothetical protein
MIKKRQVIVFVMLVALTAVGVLNLDTVEVSAAEDYAIYISPAYVTVGGCTEIGSNYTFSIRTNYTGSDICGYEFELTYDPTVLEGVNVTNGDLITETKNDTATWSPGEFNNTVGTLSRTGASYLTLYPPPYLTSGPGILANVTFTVVGCGISNIALVEEGWATKLIGYQPEPWHPRDYDEDGYFYIIDQYWPDVGHLVGSVFDHSASHDVAIIDVSPNQTNVVQGSDVGINVTAENQGQSTESFTVTVYRDATAIQTLPVTDLAAGNDTTLTFTWDTTGIPFDSYVISANASTVEGETDTADNGKTDGTVTIGSKSVEISYIVITRRGHAVSEGYTTWSVNVTVTVHNNCTLPINCTVNLYYYNATVTQQIGTSQNVNNMDPDDYTGFTLVWDLSACMACGNYTLKANATIPSIASWEFVGGLMRVRLTGDVSGDGLTTGLDVLIVTSLANFGKTVSEAADPYADVTGDGLITGLDVLVITSIANFGQACPP